MTCTCDKKEDKKPYSGKLGIHPDHPHHRIEIQFGIVDGLRELVLSFKFHQNQLSGYQDQNLVYCMSQTTCNMQSEQHTAHYY